MASPRGKRPAAAGATLESCLAEARAGSPAPVYVFDGDAYLAARAARELVAVLVPAAERDLNVVELDPAAAPGEVAAELRTRGLFAQGRKVVLVEEPAFLASREDSDAAFGRARDAWAQGRQRDGARRLLALAAKAGWAAQDLRREDGQDPARFEDEQARAWKRQLAVELQPGDGDFLDGAARYALEREMRAAREDASALDALLAAGLPPGHVLVVAAGKVDGRLPLVKRLAALGRRVGFGFEKAGTWDDQRLVLGPVLEALLAGTGKRVDRAAEELLAERVGEDARTLASEVAKLVAYVGERKVIGAEDVDRMVTRVAQDPFFALGNAVEARDLPRALAVLGRSIDDGAAPHMLVGSLAGTVRRLVVERERGRRAVGDRAIRDFHAWQAAVLPHVPAEELGDRKPFGFWKKFEAAQRYRREELLDGLAGLAEADVGMKTGGDGRLLLERVLWTLMAAEARRDA